MANPLLTSLKTLLFDQQGSIFSRRFSKKNADYSSDFFFY